MEKYRKEFTQCPCCGSTSRFCESLGNELKESGLGREEWNFSLDFKQGAVVDKAMEKKITIGSEVPSYRIRTDICLDCGCLYAIELEASTAKKTIVPQVISPDGRKMAGPPFELPGMNRPNLS
jgi:hypothetical protein